MTVYVDNAGISATVGRTLGRWSHMTADTQDELHEFATSIGLKRSWFQARCKSRICKTCVHWHYDVTASKREAAIRAGAHAIDIRELGRIVSKRREAMNGEPLDGAS